MRRQGVGTLLRLGALIAEQRLCESQKTADRCYCTKALPVTWGTVTVHVRSGAVTVIVYEARLRP